MYFCDYLAGSWAPKPPETLTSSWLLLLSSIKSWTLPCTRTHITILALQPFSSSSLSFIHSSHLHPDCLIHRAVATETWCSLTFAALLLPLGGPACCFPCISLACSTMASAREGPCNIQVPSLPTGDHLQPGFPDGRNFASCWLFSTPLHAVWGMLAEQGMGCTARAFLADALLCLLPALWASPPADSRASLLHKLLCEFEDRYPHTCLELQKPVPVHLELTLGRKQKPIHDEWGGKFLLVNPPPLPTTCCYPCC